MFDIYFGLFLVLTASLVVFVAAARFPRGSSRRQGQLLAAACMAGTALYALFLRDSALVVHWLPFSNLIVIGNWYPIAAAAVAGLAWRHSTGGWLRRSWPVAALSAVALFAAIHPLLGTTPDCGDRWDGQGVCRQTTPFTCTAACAATMLKMHGIPANEQEMARLCFTRRGTTWQGLYRGLKKKVTGTPLDVEAFSCSADELRARTPGCLIITVGLPPRGNVDPIYERQYSWNPGTMHTVLLFGFSGNDRVDMADPDVGKEQWSVRDLEVLFRGRGLRLVPRSSGQPDSPPRLPDQGPP